MASPTGGSIIAMVCDACGNRSCSQRPRGCITKKAERDTNGDGEVDAMGEKGATAAEERCRAVPIARWIASRGGVGSERPA
jgi:hypothetical protein